MPLGANWKGYLKLSLVTCQGALFPATSDKEKVSFLFLNGATGHRLKQKYVDAETGTIVYREDRVKLAAATATPPAGASYVHEVKFDGYRLQAVFEKRHAVIRTRLGLDWTEKFPFLGKSHRRIADRKCGLRRRSGR